MKTFHTFLNANIRRFHSVSYHISKNLLVSAKNKLFAIIFTIFQDSWVIAVDSFFQKFPQKEVRWHEV